MVSGKVKRSQLLYFAFGDSAVEIGFSQPAYAANETIGSVEICVSLSGNTAKRIGVSFDTMNETAIGNAPRNSI